MDEPELRARLALHLVPGIGPKTSEALLRRFGSAAAVLSASFSALREVSGVGAALAERISEARPDGPEVAAEWNACERHHIRLIPRDDLDYPAPLKNIPSQPGLIYVKGGLEPVDQLGIAIVGARRCTPYGARAAERLASSLARVGFTIISGLARGIDAAAHRGALKVGGRTIAVLANGLASVYPPEHLELAEEVAGSGALVSELPMGQSPLAMLFPQRNRIITGLSLGLIVVEATPRSGTLATVQHALEQNREVFAVPGPIDSLASRGCHQLIREGATLVESADDVLEALGPLAKEVRPAVDEPVIRHPAELILSDQERAILGELGHRPITVDELVAHTGLTASQLMATLSVLEIRRLVKRLPGMQFVRP